MSEVARLARATTPRARDGRQFGVSCGPDKAQQHRRAAEVTAWVYVEALAGERQAPYRQDSTRDSDVADRRLPLVAERPCTAWVSETQWSLMHIHVSGGSVTRHGLRGDFRPVTTGTPNSTGTPEVLRYSRKADWCPVTRLGECPTSARRLRRPEGPLAEAARKSRRQSGFGGIRFPLVSWSGPGPGPLLC